MESKKLKISGFGGQGIILSSYIVGKAASVFDGKAAAMTQVYGPEARGGACSSQVVINEDFVDYPLVDTADVLVAMSQEGCDKFLPILKSGGILFYDDGFVSGVDSRGKFKALSIPATGLAEKLGKKIVANIVMLGFMTAHTDLVSAGAMEAAIRDSVPEKYVEVNLTAFKTGLEYTE